MITFSSPSSHPPDSGAASATVPRLPIWIVLLDIAIGVVLVLLVAAVLFGGPRLTYADVRITATSPWKLGGSLALLFAVRHGLLARPAWWSVVARLARRAWRHGGVRQVWPWVVSTRLTVLLATYVGVLLIGYPSAEPPFRVAGSEAGNLLARWDTGWYLGIAEEGYNYWGNANHQTNVAFFPAYPMTVRFVGAALGARWGSPDDPSDTFEAFTARRHVRMLQAGWLVSVTSLFVGLAYLFRLARELTGSDDDAERAVALTATYPFAFFFGAVYTEAFFLACAVAAFYHMRHRQWAWAAAFGLVAGLARPNGCLLSVPLGLMALAHWRADGYRVPTLAWGLLAASMAGIGMLLFTWWLHAFTGEWFVWMKAHGAWGRQFSGLHVLLAQRWGELWSLGLTGYSVAYTLEMFNMAATALVLAVAWPVGRRYGWSYAAFLLITVVPPLFMGGFMSMGRVTATLFPVFIYLATCLGPRATPHVLLVSFGLQTALAVMHFTWRQVF